MTLLHALHQLLGSQAQQQGQAMQPQQPQSHGAPMQMHPQQGIPLTKQMGGMTFPNTPGMQYEDSSLRMGPQGPVPMTSDIANFRGQPLPQGGQMGYSGFQDHGFRTAPTVQQQSYMSGQGIQAFQHQNPQLRDNGYFWNN